MNESPVIEAAGLRKEYGSVRALDGLDLSVDHGEVHGFLGPNGAGKSTTIRILLGLTRASGGSVRLLDGDTWRDAASLHRRVASVPGDVSVWPNLSGGEAIDLLARLRGAARSDQVFQSERARLCRVFDFDPRKKGRAYSKGNWQKIALIAAFAIPAEVYILDEPTSGLDPLMEAAFREEIARVRSNGSAVLLSSHILSEVEQLCDRVSIIRSGRVVDHGTLQELRRLSASEVSFTVPSNGEPPTFRGLAGAQRLDQDRGRERFVVPTDEVPAILPELTRIGATDLQITPPTLESMFLHLYADDLSTGSNSGATRPGHFGSDPGRGANIDSAPGPAATGSDRRRRASRRHAADGAP